MPEPPAMPEFEQIRGAAPAGPADLLREARAGGAPQLRLSLEGGVSTFLTDRARIGMKDNDGEFQITMHEGQRTLTAKSADGGIEFTGPIDTPEQRAVVPPQFRAKLEAIEEQQRSLVKGRAPGFPGGRDEAP